ncbi:hypothetical protein ACLH9T_004746 [Salmonella enterica]|nr:hypothetical protein [Salmonella enterica subsp. enterica serovar Oranienburg]EFQ5903136.1 hypothetical protein [Salmonella enterica]EEE0365511.1 hypothetical protein [Salmonella enterica subsp. enterica serovar Oranienburg]EGF6148063.1 hypothetical protein [Salmonella enterica]EGM7071002.1 hypothetical protein [Salmonella enterica subsp. enterica serovar Oranienburg]
MYHQWADLSVYQPEERTQAQTGGATAARRIAMDTSSAYRDCSDGRDVAISQYLAAV